MEWVLKNSRDLANQAGVEGNVFSGVSLLGNSEVIIATTGVCENCNGLEPSLHPSQHGQHCESLVLGLCSTEELQNITCKDTWWPESCSTLWCPAWSLRLIGASSDAQTRPLAIPNSQQRALPCWAWHRHMSSRPRLGFLISEGS